jgi:hypothetical protein
VKAAVAARAGYFDGVRCRLREGMESREDLFQLTQARVTQAALKIAARETGKYSTRCVASSTAGLKMKATASQATVVVYVVPVDFW